MSDSLAARLANIELVAFDVDGVFTDGRFYLSDDGVETKSFNTQDGYGIRRLLDAGVAVAVISGRASAAVEKRMQELGVRHVFLACKDKVAAFRGLIDELGVAVEQTAYVGDDGPDIPLLEVAAVGVAVANAHRSVLDVCDCVTSASGGHGAVREVCDAILDGRGSGSGP